MHVELQPGVCGLKPRSCFKLWAVIVAQNGCRGCVLEKQVDVCVGRDQNGERTRPWSRIEGGGGGGGGRGRVGGGGERWVGNGMKA